MLRVLVNTCCLTAQNSKWPLSSVFNFTCLTYWDFGYHVVPQWYPNYYHVKVWCLSFQMPCRIHFFDVWLSSSYQLHFEFRTWFLLENGITSMRPFVHVVKHDRKRISMNRVGDIRHGFLKLRFHIFEWKNFRSVRTHPKEFRVITSRYKTT